jgi:hypothetical protein
MSGRASLGVFEIRSRRMQTGSRHRREGDLTLAFAGLSALFPAQAKSIFDSLQAAIVHEFGWFYIEGERQPGRGEEDRRIDLHPRAASTKRSPVVEIVHVRTGFPWCLVDAARGCRSIRRSSSPRPG